MEAMITRASAPSLGIANADWRRTVTRVGGAALRFIQHLLVSYSRAALLLRGGERPARRV